MTSENKKPSAPPSPRLKLVRTVGSLLVYRIVFYNSDNDSPPIFLIWDKDNGIFLSPSYHSAEQAISAAQDHLKQIKESEKMSARKPSGHHRA